MIDLRPLIDPNFWFNLTPPSFSPFFEKALFLIFGFFVIFGAVARIVARHKKEDRHVLRVYKMIGQMFLSMGLIGLTFFFFSFEEIYLLSARFWFALWGISLIVWIVMIIRYAKVTIPMLRQEEIEKHKRNEYLPRKNRRR